jgi:predicted N-acetyltransferase YhbS
VHQLRPEQVGAGWPSAVLELTARAFDLGGREADEVARRRRVGRRFLDTMLVAPGG